MENPIDGSKNSEYNLQGLSRIADNQKRSSVGPSLDRKEIYQIPHTLGGGALFPKNSSPKKAVDSPGVVAEFFTNEYYFPKKHNRIDEAYGNNSKDQVMPSPKYPKDNYLGEGPEVQLASKQKLHMDRSNVERSNYINVINRANSEKREQMHERY